MFLFTFHSTSLVLFENSFFLHRWRVQYLIFLLFSFLSSLQPLPRLLTHCRWKEPFKREAVCRREANRSTDYLLQVVPEGMWIFTRCLHRECLRSPISIRQHAAKIPEDK